MQYVFGPVASRRMGLSLGLDIIPKFTCTYNCIYCEVGFMVHQTLKRAEYVPVEDVLAELTVALARYPRLDYITFSGSGEPTLHSGIGRMIREIKQMTNVPVAIITSGALLYQRRVREDLMQADLVMPSLDAVTQSVFERIDRSRVKIARVIEGIRQFRQEFPGQIWLEILFVKGINDTPDEVRKLAEVVHTLGADRIQLNTVVRPPSEREAEPLTREELEAIREVIGPPAEVVATFHQEVPKAKRTDLEADLLALLERRGCTFEEIANGLQITDEMLEPLLARLTREGTIESTLHHGVVYYRSGRGGG